MPSFTLDQINEAADRQYGPFVIEGIPGGDVTLLNALRMPKTQRKRLIDYQKAANAILEDPSAGSDEADDTLPQMIRLVAASKADADRLLKWAGDDQAKLAVVMQQYGKASQGEA